MSWKLIPFIMLLLLGAGEICYAGPQRDQVQLKKAISRRQRVIADFTNQEKTTQKRLSKIDKKRAQSRRKAANLAKQLAVKQRALKVSEQEVSALSEQFDQRRIAVGQRLRRIYKHSRTTYLEVLLNASSIKNLVMRMKLLTRIMERNHQDLGVLKQQQDDLNAKRLQVQKEVSGLAKKVSTQNKIYARLQRERRQEKKRLEKLGQDIYWTQKKLKKLKADYARIERLVDKIAAQKAPVVTPKTGPAVPKRRGGSRAPAKMKRNYSLDWPARGKLVSRYGRQYEQEFGASLKRNGIEIAVSGQQDVRVVFPGVVRFADNFRSFGKLVIVDHQNGYFTVYGHLTQFAVTVGQKVAYQQPLGAIDSDRSGYDRLYFEIRDRYRSYNPLAWLIR